MRINKLRRPITAFFPLSVTTYVHKTRMLSRRATQAAKKKLIGNSTIGIGKSSRPERSAFLLRASGCHIRAHRKRLSQRAESVSSLSVSVPPAGDRVPNVLQSCQNGSLLWAYPTAQATLQQHSYSLQSALRPGIRRSCRTATTHVWFWHWLDLARTTLGE